MFHCIILNLFKRPAHLPRISFLLLQRSCISEGFAKYEKNFSMLVRRNANAKCKFLQLSAISRESRRALYKLSTWSKH